MPQMFPMNWIILFSIFTLLLFLIKSILFFLPNLKTQINSTTQFSIKTLFKKTWLW